jgi:hypothetical protein
MWQRNKNCVLNTKCYVWGKCYITHYQVPLFICSSIVVVASCYWYACHWQGLGSYFRIKRNGIGKILNLVHSAFKQTLGDKFSFQQDNNLKDKAKYTLELAIKTTLNVPEWPT